MSGSIRNRIILSHWLVVLLVLLLLGPLACWLLTGELKKQRFQELGFLATHMAGMIDSRLDWYSRLFTDIVRDPLVKNFPETARVPAVAELFARQKETFPAMVLMDAKGWEEVRVINGRNLPYLGPFPNRDFFNAAVQSPNRVLWGKPMSSSLVDETVIPFAYGIQRYFGREFIGVLYGELRLARLTSFLGTVSVGRTGFLLLVDSQRRLLYHPDPQKVLAVLNPSTDGSDWVQLALGGNKGVGEGGILGVEALLGYAPIQGLNAALIAVLPQDEFLEAPKKMKKAILMVMVVLLMIAAVVACWFSVRLTRPLLQLTELAGQVAGGQLPDKVTVDRSGDEIDKLVEAFGQMLAELRNSMVSRHYLNRILVAMNEALLLVGLDGKIRSANRAACELLAMPEKEVIGRQLESLFVVDASSGDPWLQVLLAEPGARQTRQVLKSAEKNVPVRLCWTALADAGGHVREVACLFSPLSGAENADLSQGTG